MVWFSGSRTMARWIPCLPVAALLACAGCSMQSEPSMSEEQQAAEGRILYEVNGCATCHGNDGRGDGPVAKTLHSSPRDFRDPAAFVKGYNVEQIAHTLETGLVEGTQSMPSYTHLSQNERQMLAAFVMSLRTESGGSSTNEAQVPELVVKNAWARIPLAPQNNSAVYMVLENPSTTARSVVSVTTVDADKAELHEMRMEGNMMTMMPVKEVVVPAKGSVELKSGGIHIMVFQVRKPVKAGDQLNLVLKLNDGASEPVVATVRSADASPAAPAADHSMHGMMP